jgi:hypothetical protein
VGDEQEESDEGEQRGKGRERRKGGTQSGDKEEAKWYLAAGSEGVDKV